jgi:hypothetical protein
LGRTFVRPSRVLVINFSIEQRTTNLKPVQARNGASTGRLAKPQCN